MKYVFGVMTKVWTLESNNKKTAEIGMCIFIGKNIPIVIYEPESYAIMPSKTLENYQDDYEPKEVESSIDSIKEVR